jgi:hypothetical protein
MGACASIDGHAEHSDEHGMTISRSFLRASGSYTFAHSFCETAPEMKTVHVVLAQRTPPSGSGEIRAADGDRLFGV